MNADGPPPGEVAADVITLDRVQRLLARTVDDTGSDPGAATVVDIQADLARLGVTSGSVVIIALSNGKALITHYFAVLLLGAVPLLVSPATSPTRLAELGRRLGAGLLVTARPATTGFGERRVGAVYGVLLTPPGTGPAHTAPPAALDPPSPPDLTGYAPGEVLMLTSGTSGMFSACVHTVAALLRNARRHADAVGLGADDVILISLPLHYSFALVAQMFAALVTGARLMVTGPPFSLASYRSALGAHDVTSSSITPTLARTLLQAPDLPPGLRMLTVGGDHLPAEDVAALLRLRPGGELYVTYGLTEAGPRVATLAAHAEPGHRFGSVGRPLSGVTVSLRAAEAPVVSSPTTPVGELVVHTDTALVRTAGTRASDARQPLIAPGIVATGDLFALDDADCLWFRGRRSDIAMIRGEKVSLSSVRHAVLSVPGVLRCVPQVAQDGDRTVLDLLVDVSAENGPDETGLRRALATLLLPAERPRRITVTVAEHLSFHK